MIPSETVLRKSYLRECHQSKMDKIKEKLTGRKLWVSIDETTDSCGRAIVNCVIGTLSPDPEGCKPYLINTGVFNRFNVFVRILMHYN